MKTEQELHDLMKESVRLLTTLFIAEGKLRVPETDAIIETVYSNFFANSIASIPKYLREDYIKKRLQEHGNFLTEVVNDLLKMIEEEEIESNKEEEPETATIH